MCSFCCVASVVKSLVSVSFSLAFFSTKYRSSKILFHTLLTFMHMSCSSRTKHHKHKLYQHLYSYILQHKWHYKTCLALAASTALLTQTVQASGTFVDYHAVLFSYSLVRLNWFAISLDGTYAKTRTYCPSAFQLRMIYHVVLAIVHLTTG